MTRGLFVTFEGTEGTGKSTQVSLLGDALVHRGREVVCTREPGGTALGQDLRRMLLGYSYGKLSREAELYLYMADRAQHMAEVIVPALDEGKVVICDRFVDATVAYQGFGRGIERSTIDSLNAGATAGIMPDVTLLLDLEDLAKGLRRAVGRNRQDGADGVEDRFEREEEEFHRQVRRGYRTLAAEDPGRVRVIAADGSADQVHREIMVALEPLLFPAAPELSGGAR